MKRPLATIGGTGASASFRRSAALLATASAIALLCHVPRAAAQDCSGAPPADIATPAALYETLRDRTDAQLLAIGFAQQPAAACAWVYEVKMLTASGAVVELDFAARGLDLIGARGPENDKEVATLVRGLGGNASTLITGNAKGNGGGPGASGGGGTGEAGGGGDHPGGDDGGDDGGGDDGGEGGEGGNSGSGSDNSGSGGSGSGSGGSGGGEGGEGGGSSGSGGGGSGSGGEGGGDD